MNLSDSWAASQLEGAVPDDLVEAWSQVEVRSCELAAVHRSHEQMRSMSVLAQLLDSTSDSDEWTSLQLSFYSAFAEASGNSALDTMAFELAGLMSDALDIAGVLWSTRASVQQDMRQVLQCIESGESIQAASAMSEHVRRVAAVLDGVTGPAR